MTLFRLLSLAAVAFLFSCTGTNDQLYEELEKHLARRVEVTKAKENSLLQQKRRLASCTNAETRYLLCDSLVREYLLFNSDSASQYIDENIALAQQLGNDTYLNKAYILQAYILATAGNYSNARESLAMVEKSTLDTKDLTDYYETWRWLYNTWEAYVSDKNRSKQYAEKGYAYLDSLCETVDEKSADGLYFLAERQLTNGNLKEAETLYLKCIDMLTPEQRRYASATCALAMVYEMQGRYDDFEHYIILAAISDNIIPLKENLAMQILAKYLSQQRNDYTLAQRYLIYSVEDAIYYNGRLRLTEIARKLPDIALGYQSQEEAQDKQEATAIAVVGLLTLGLLCVAIYSMRQNRDLKAQRRMRIALNEKLRATNNRREQYVSLFIELCAAYIDKYNRFQKTIERKIKAHQTDDLLQLVHTSRMKETDAKEFFMNFDRAFLDLYPQFVEEFNALLQPEHRIMLKKDQLLNAELRIMAFLRLGIKDTTNIATMLMYSPQTIYNYRSSLKSHAIAKDSFEDDVTHLCAGE